MNALDILSNNWVLLSILILTVAATAAYFLLGRLLLVGVGAAICGVILVFGLLAYFEFIGDAGQSDVQRFADYMAQTDTDTMTTDQVIAAAKKSCDVSYQRASELLTAYVSLQIGTVEHPGLTRIAIASNPDLLSQKVKLIKSTQTAASTVTNPGSIGAAPCPCPGDGNGIVFAPVNQIDIAINNTSSVGNSPSAPPIVVSPPYVAPPAPRVNPAPVSQEPKVAPTPISPPKSECDGVKPFGRPYNDLDSVPAGICAVLEVDYWDGSRQATIFGGINPAPFKTCDHACSPVQSDAWWQYPTVYYTQQDACGQAEKRAQDPGFGGFTFTVTSGGCSFGNSIKNPYPPVTSYSDGYKNGTTQQPTAGSNPSPAATQSPAGSTVQAVKVANNVYGAAQITLPGPAGSNELWMIHGDITDDHAKCHYLVFDSGQAVNKPSSATWDLVRIYGGSHNDRLAYVQSLANDLHCLPA